MTEEFFGKSGRPFEYASSFQTESVVTDVPDIFPEILMIKRPPHPLRLTKSSQPAAADKLCCEEKGPHSLLFRLPVCLD
jgi:hypothetical protein